MMFSDRSNSERLRSFIAFAGVNSEMHLVSYGEFVEAFLCNRITMKVDFRSIAIFDKAIVLLGKEIGDSTMFRERMSLGFPALPADIVLKSAAHRIEAIMHRNINVLMSVVP